MNTPVDYSKLIKSGRLWFFLLTMAALFMVAVIYFGHILVHLLVAFVFSMIGQPIVSFLRRRLRIPLTWACVITILAFLGLLSCFVWLIIPLVMTQADTFASIDYVQIGNELSKLLVDLQEYVWHYGLMPLDQSFEQIFQVQMRALASSINLNMIVTNVTGLVGSLFMGLFSVVFILFFFLKDQNLFYQMILLFVPSAYERQAENIIVNSRTLLTRYFAGLLAEVVAMMLLISVVLMIFGVKNALLLGFIGGLLNVIPYLGPLIGATIASVLAYTTALSGGYSPELIWVVVKVIIAFSGSNMIDNMVLQPLIYSNSVKAHPLEIFIVIMMAGSLAGVVGMILAIPVYTLLRIVAKEFFKQSKFVSKLTQKL